MKLRLLLLAGIAALVIVTAYWLLPSAPSAAQAGAPRDDRPTTSARAPSLEAPSIDSPKPRMVMTESGLRPQTNKRKPREWVDPVSGAVNREILDAVPDPAAAAAEELKYRKSRLRLTLADAAAPCWTGGDSKEEIELEYTLVVEKEQIRADNVRIKNSNITNPTVERCITDAVRDLRTLGDKIPDMREEQGLVMSLHDLQDRNTRAAKNHASASDDPREPFDRPTAKPPGN